MGTHMKRRSKRKSRKSRKRRAGANMNDAAFKAQMSKVAAASKQTMADADKAIMAAAKAKEDTSRQMREARTAGIPNICRLDIMKDTKKCKKAAEMVAKGAKVLKGTSAGIKAKADKLKAAGLSQLGGKRKRRTKRRRKSRKSKKSRRKSRKTKRRRKSKKRRSRRRR